MWGSFFLLKSSFDSIPFVLLLSIMKTLKLTSSILLAASIVWIGYQFYTISNNELDFLIFKEVPISIALLISLLLYKISQPNRNISLLFLVCSTIILCLGFFSVISVELLFKIESITLLFSGAFALNSIGNTKNNLFTIVYFGTAVIFSLSLVLEISTLILQFTQIGFGILTTLFALISSFRRSH